MKVTADNLSVCYGTSQILHNINLTFKSNAISAIIGPSGCGKTTLLRAINRTAELYPKFSRSGEVYLDSTPLYEKNDAAEVRRLIGMVFQKPVILPFSIKENVLFGPRYYGVNSKSHLDCLTEQLLSQVGLWHEVKDKLNRPARELSGGQQQRLSIARVLAVQPKVLLLDEPCSNLDILSTRLIEELLTDLAPELSIILVTHNLAQARRIAAEIIFMSAGCVIEQDATDKLFTAPAQTETQDFLAMQ